MTEGLSSPGAGAPLQVLLNVYDVAQGDGKGTVVRLNNLVGPKGLGLGGVFHGAIVLGTVEFSFGFCEQGTGVYAVKAGKNPMYTFRETVDLGPTSKSMQEIRDIVQQLKLEWPGASYDLLYRNCCHFCVDLAERLEVSPVPGWLNRFASGAAATINITQDTVKTVQGFGAEVGRLWSKTLAAASQQQQQIAEKLQQQQGWRSSSSGMRIATPRSSNSLLTPRSSQLADSATQAGQQLWSGLAQAGQQLKATTSRLAQAAAAKAGSSTPRSFTSRYSSSSCASDTPFGQQHTNQDSHAAQAAAASATASYSPAVSLAADAPGDGGAAPGSLQGAPDRSPAQMLLGAQPKLSKQYRLSGGGAHPPLGDTSAGGPASVSGGGANNSLPSTNSEDVLMPFLSIDDNIDPFVALVGDDDAEDDAQQQASVESKVQHTPVAIPGVQPHYEA